MEASTLGRLHRLLTVMCNVFSMSHLARYQSQMYIAATENSRCCCV